MSTNRSLAIAILLFLLLSEVISIGSSVVHCRSCKGLAPYNVLKARHQNLTTHQNINVVGGTGNFVGAGNFAMTAAPEPRPFVGGFGRNRNYDSYSADTQIIIDGNIIEKNRGGFSGAVIHPPQSTVIHPPVGYPQYSGATNQNPQFRPEDQSYISGESVNALQEQNRLLREQIALQQQQLQLIQQQQQCDASLSPPPPPPSYESCMQDPVQMKFLQEQNAELQSRYQSQQQQIMGNDRHITPSAPPI